MTIQDIIRFLCWTIPILVWDGIRLICFVICLLPGFIRFGWYYYVTSTRKSVVYGKASCRQSLDVYYNKHYYYQDNSNTPNVNETFDIEQQQRSINDDSNNNTDSRPLLQTTDIESATSSSSLSNHQQLKP